MSPKIPDDIREEIEKKGGLENILRNLPSESRLEKYTGLYSALGDPLRLKILCFLCKQRACVCLLREIVDLSYSRLSYHLSVMKNGGLIWGEKKGNYVIYSLTSLGKKYCKEICRGEKK